MTLDYKKPNFAEMKDFMRKQVRFSSLESTQPEFAGKLFDKTVDDAKNRFYNYARMAGQEEKIKAKLEKTDIDVVAEKAPRVKKERMVDPEAEARRAERAAKRAKTEE